jgi:hypothetical protein
MNTVTDYCLDRAWQLRLRPDDSRWLIGVALEELMADPPDGKAGEHSEYRTRLSARLTNAVRQHYGNPVVAWILLYVVVPVVVKLVIEWWFNPREV